MYLIQCFSTRRIKLNTFGKVVVTVIVVAIILAAILFLSPLRVAFWNKVHYNVQKMDDATNYDTLKKVEDSCRAMMASYQSAKLTYEQYIDSDNPDEVSWANQAKISANRTASTYNNYVLQNSFVWAGNVPADIKSELPYLQ